MGLNSLVVKCHGQSEFKGVSYAADIIYSLLENEVNEKKWSDKYKKSIDCNNPKGFSQKAHCAGRKKRK